MPEVGNLQFSYVGESSSFKKASEQVEERLKEQEKLLEKSEKKFLTFNKVVIASGVGLTALAVKKIPKVNSAFKAVDKGAGLLFKSLDKILVASKGFIGPFAKVGTAVSGVTVGFEGASFAMDILGVSTSSALGGFVKLGGVLSGAAAVGLTGFISLVQVASDTLGNKLLTKTQEYLEVGARLETQTFALGLSLESYRKATGDASVTTESMTKLLDKLGRTTGLTRGELKGGLTTMLNLSRVTGLTSKQIEKLIQRAAEMSVALGTDFNEAVVAIDQSFKGYNAQLLNFGVNINEGTLAQTKFVKSQDRSVDALSASNLALAKYEAILSQSSTAVGVLAKANNTIQGSALNMELAIESFSNRMGETTQKILGPFVVKINQLTAAFFDFKGKGGLAKVSVLLTVFGGILFKGIAVILKWGAALVIAQQAFKILGLAVRSVSKIVSFFSGALRFLAVMARKAEIALRKLGLETQKYGIFANIAAASSKGLGVAAGGLEGASTIAGKAADKAKGSFGGFAFSAAFLLKTLKVLGKGLLSFVGTMAIWSAAVVAAGLVATAFIGVLKAIGKAVLRAFGTDSTRVLESFKSKLESISESLREFTEDLVNFPEKVALAAEISTNFLAIATKKKLGEVIGFSEEALKSIRVLENANEDLIDDFRALVRGPKEGDESLVKQKFEDSRALKRLQKEAANERIKFVNQELFLQNNVKLVSARINQLNSDLIAIKKPEIQIQKDLNALEERRVALTEIIHNQSKAGFGAQIKSSKQLSRIIKRDLETQKKIIAAKEIIESRTNSEQERSATREDLQRAKERIALIEKEGGERLRVLKAEEEIVSIIEEMGVLTEKRDKGVVVNNKNQQEQQRISEEIFRLEQDRLKIQNSIARNASEIASARRLEVELQAESIALDKITERNRFKIIENERKIILEREKENAKKFKEVQDAAKLRGVPVGDAQELANERNIVEIEKEKVALLLRKIALERQLINELGPLNKAFQEERRAELKARVEELEKIGASTVEIVRLRAKAEQDNQRDIWQAVSEQSNNALQILEAKMFLYFEDVRSVAQKTSEFLFNVFTALEKTTTDAISNVALGLTSINQGFKDFRRAILDLVISSLVELGIQQAKTFLIQESGFSKAISGLQTEGAQVEVLASQYAQLGAAKASAAAAGGTTKLPLGNNGSVLDRFLQFTGLQAAPNTKGGPIGPTLPSGKFFSGTGGAGGSSISGAFGAAGIGAAGGGLLGSLIGGPEGAKSGAIGGALGAGLGSFGGPPGAIIGGLLGSIAGGFIGRRKRKRKKREAEAARRAVEEIKGLSEALRLESKTLDQALNEVNKKIKSNTKEARKAWEDFRKELVFQRKTVVKELAQTSKDVAAQIKLLQTDFVLRGVASQLEGFKKQAEDLKKQYSQLQNSAVEGMKLATTLFIENTNELKRQLTKALKEQRKSFEEGARDNAGNLISIAQRAAIDIKKLNEDRLKLEKDFNKSIKDIQNEGVAQRQKTIKKDKEERIAALTKEFNLQKLNLDNQISTIKIVTAEKTKANDKALSELQSQLDLVNSFTTTTVSNQVEEAAIKQAQIENPLTPAGNLNLDNPNARISTPFQRQVLLNTLNDIEKNLSAVNARISNIEQGFLPPDRIAEFRNPQSTGGEAITSKEINRLLINERAIRDRILAFKKRVTDLFFPQTSGFVSPATSDGQTVLEFGGNVPVSRVTPNPVSRDIPTPFFGNSKATGGEITKTEPVLIHKGEFVVQEKFAQRMLPLLEAMNQGQIPLASPSNGRSGNQGGLDMSINVSIGSVDSRSRIKEVEEIVKKLQRRQLNSVRQMVTV